MSDARSLLRAHRAVTRIEHPQATYSDSGKLQCKLCRETVRTEALWKAHLRSWSHQQQAAATLPADQPSGQKRKHVEVDEPVSDGSARDDVDLVRKKRSKMDTVTSTPSGSGPGTPIGSRSGADDKTMTPPPSLSRRTSGTPSQGVEIMMTSRPATPKIRGDRSHSASSNRSLRPVSLSSTDALASIVTPGESVGSKSPIPPISTEALPSSQTTAQEVDEAEWATFEAEVAMADQPAAGGYTDATISAPAMTAAQLVAKSQEEERQGKKHLRDVEIADEKEDARRALEIEFEEMEELENRVRRLKERRAVLRQSGSSTAVAHNPDAAEPTSGSEAQKENAILAAAKLEEHVEEDDEEDDDDDWDDCFRFRV